ncbi:MAG TPA: translation elongation factor Ts [Myxococcota bacterium]|nr:translation elongation factor Ts [Myxococcota bacterium]HOA14215.1 translation elongation factor Ts [Myxococcota bacterium]HOC99726.1 translation elongation factor Ts [Myxococcota bacterium]HOH77467.1 translation elongation factor Ts [Myxococcota bacterium]HPV05081.1 translation elongation factor Ts [Myxococcota bacterium]
MAIDSKLVKELREMTGAGILDCKNALESSNGDMNGAIEYLKKRNQAAVVKKMSREAKDGKIASYIHGDGRIGVLVEINSETDFVARSEGFQDFVKEVMLQITSMNPKYLKPEDIPEADMAAQKDIFMGQMEDVKKPEEVKAKIIEGKMAKWFTEVCLLEQPYIRDDSKKVKDLLTEVVGRCGENIRVRRFMRFELGEGL